MSRIEMNPQERAAAVLALLDGLDKGHPLTADACRAVRLAISLYRWCGLLEDRIDNLALGVVFGDRVHFLLTHDAARLDEFVSTGPIEDIAADVFRMVEREEAAYA